MYNYPYGNTYQPFQNNNNNNMNNNYNQQQQPQIPFMPLTFTSGLVGAKAYIVAPNNTVYLKDSDTNSNLLFEKSADSYGRYTLKAFELKEVPIDSIGKEKPVENKIDYVTKEEFIDLKTKVEQLLKVGEKNE